MLAGVDTDDAGDAQGSVAEPAAQRSATPPPAAAGDAAQDDTKADDDADTPKSGDGRASDEPAKPQSRWESVDAEAAAAADATVKLEPGPRTEPSRSSTGVTKKALVDAVLVLYCVLVPVIAAVNREAPEGSGDETCYYRIEESQVSSPVVELEINKTSGVCLSEAPCDRACEAVDLGLFLPQSKSVKVAIALIPFIVVFQGILSFKLSSRYVAPAGMLVTIVLGLSFFRDASYFDGDSTPTAAGKASLIVVDRLFWAIFEYAFNVFTAFFFMRILEIWGIVQAMREEFADLAPTANRKVLLVGFSFAILLAVVAPGGSNYIIAGAILIEMDIGGTGKPIDHPDRVKDSNRIGLICLFGNALISAFNLMGICITTIAEDIRALAIDPPYDNDVEMLDYASKEIGRTFSMQFFLFATISPFLCACLFSSKEGITEKIKDVFATDGWVLLSAGFVYALVQLLVSWLIGPELPCLLAGGISGVTYVAWERRNQLQCPSLHKRKWALPFAILILVLLAMRVIPGVEEVLTGGDDETAQGILNPYVWDINSGGVRLKRQFPWLWHSGVVVLVVGLVTPWMVDYTPSGPLISLPLGAAPDAPFMGSSARSRPKFKKIVRKVMLASRVVRYLKVDKAQRRRQAVSAALRDSFWDVLPVVFSITSFASIAKLMDVFGMTSSIAGAIVEGWVGCACADAFRSLTQRMRARLSDAPIIYALFMPIIGTLGSGLTGSTTTSNFLFGRLQVTTAKDLGLVTATRNSVFEVAGVQVLGASAGEIIAPMNAIVITLMDGVNMSEDGLIKRLLPLATTWLALSKWDTLEPQLEHTDTSLTFGFRSPHLIQRAAMVVSLIFLGPEGGFD